eukprot:m.353288 g.353288  ORF g.353288 m.353288 type:complete len:275 (+) comp16721_c0_seq1:449-1273(+)
MPNPRATSSPCSQPPSTLLASFRRAKPTPPKPLGQVNEHTHPTSTQKRPLRHTRVHTKLAKMEWLFGRKKTPEEMMKENQRLLRRAMRELDRERTGLERQERKTLQDIKKAAKAGQVDAAKIMAKDVVRTRRFQKKMILMKTQIQAVSLKIQTLKATNSMARAMAGVTKAMRRMNQSMNLPSLMQVMAEFEKQSEMMEMKQEMMDDTVDDVLGEEEDDEESEVLVNQVLDELGLSLNSELGAVPVGVQQPEAEAAVADPGEADLLARLNQLKRE